MNVSSTMILYTLGFRLVEICCFDCDSSGTYILTVTCDTEKTLGKYFECDL